MINPFENMCLFEYIVILIKNDFKLKKFSLYEQFIYFYFHGSYKVL